MVQDAYFLSEPCVRLKYMMRYEKYTIFLSKRKCHFNYTSKCNLNIFKSDIDKFETIPQIIEALCIFILIPYVMIKLTIVH